MLPKAARISRQSFNCGWLAVCKTDSMPRIAPGELAESDQFEYGARASTALAARHAFHLQAEGDIVDDCLPRK